MSDAPTTTTTQTTTTAPVEKPWFDGFDADTKGYMSNRGLDKMTPAEAAAKAIAFHREAEKLIGVPAEQVVRLPKDANDVAGWNAVHERLGKPKEAKDYDFTGLGEQADEKFVNFVRDASFKYNLPKDTAKALAADIVKFANDEESADVSASTANLERERQELKKEWGFNFEANKLVAQSAARKLGVTPEAIAAIENATGYKTVMQVFQKIGAAIGEDKFITSTVTGSVMTREGAKSRINELKADKEWVNKYLSGNAAAKKEMTDLTMIAAGGS